MTKTPATEFATKLLETVLFGGISHMLADAIVAQSDKELPAAFVQFGERIQKAENEEKALEIAEFAFRNLISYYARKAAESLTVTTKEA